MPRKKKDGRFINYYIDRTIYERLERYADDKGQQMTTAIERILEEYLNQYDAQRHAKGGNTMYCPNCYVLTEESRCSVCGSKHLRVPAGEDYCFLSEKDMIWAGALEDILKQNGIPYVTRNVLGAGLAAKMGPALERTRFYVPYAHYETANNLDQEFFNGQAADLDIDFEVDG